MKKINIPVDVAPQAYDIYIDNNFFPFIIEEIKRLKLGSRFALITDSKVRPMQGEAFLSAAKEGGLNIQIFDFPHGEASKNRTVKDHLDDCLLTNRFGRDGVIIALGGGVVGDMAGFVAATYMRGIPYIQIPTTIISQADSSIGGKTAIDVPQGKNLIGAFHHPRCVFIDVKTLETLDQRNYTSGMIEIIKHGIIQDRELFDFIDRNAEIILARKGAGYSTVMIDLLIKNCRIKNEVVAQDTKETNLRKILNYGHTIGHAVEHLSGYNLLHGEAVSIGVAVEAYFSWKLGYCTEAEYRKQTDLLKKMGLPVNIPEEMGIEEIMELMTHDKKAKNSVPEFVFNETVGQYKIFEGGKTTARIDEQKLRDLIAEVKTLSL